MTTPALSVTRILGGEPVPPSPRGRVCAEPGCSTILSIYNAGTRCAVCERHRPGGRPTRYNSARPGRHRSPAAERVCELCGATFQTRSSKARFCGEPCQMRAAHARERIKKEAAMASSREALLGALRERPGHKFKSTDLADALGITSSYVLSLAGKLRDGGEPITIVPKGQGGGIYLGDLTPGAEKCDTAVAVEADCDTPCEEAPPTAPADLPERAEAPQAPADPVTQGQRPAHEAADPTSPQGPAGPPPCADDHHPFREAGNPLWSTVVDMLGQVFSQHPERIYDLDDLVQITGIPPGRIEASLRGGIDADAIESPYPGAYRLSRSMGLFVNHELTHREPPAEELIESAPMHPEADAFSRCCDALDGASKASCRRVVAHLVDLFIAGDEEVKL